MDETEKSFGPAIFKYTREMALRDGVLVHIENDFFKYHTAVTKAVFNHVGEMKIRGLLIGSVLYRYKSWKEGGLFTFEGKNYKVICGPSDDMSPCITIMFENED